jgi:Xaa-Pro aminopeptidase
MAALFAGEEAGLDGFRVSPNFYYLTGLVVEGAVFLVALDGVRAEEMLLLPLPDPAKDRWKGPGPDPGGLTPDAVPDARRRRLMKATGFDRILYAHQAEDALVRPLRQAEVLFLDFPLHAADPRPDHPLARRLLERHPYLEVHHAGRILGELRRVKDGAEVAALERAAGGAAPPPAARRRPLRARLAA